MYCIDSVIVRFFALVRGGLNREANLAQRSETKARSPMHDLQAICHPNSQSHCVHLLFCLIPKACLREQIDFRTHPLWICHATRLYSCYSCQSWPKLLSHLRSRTPSTLRGTRIYIYYVGKLIFSLTCCFETNHSQTDCGCRRLWGGPGYTSANNGSRWS